MIAVILSAGSNTPDTIKTIKERVGTELGQLWCIRTRNDYLIAVLIAISPSQRFG